MAKVRFENSLKTLKNHWHPFYFYKEDMFC